ncbi:hypothetical protein AB1K54_12620 [Microbacterium sp. BWT-B31]|uniref:hypothetical protein n=1 Tax=Microbacterium sp. BWT-B31 TaxID=3232072 RepID=UPI00352745F3
MTHSSPAAIAWIESPLQLVGAAEWAHAHGRSIPLAGRLTPGMSPTADALLARGARFSETHPYLGIPWALLARHPHWVVGDGFSGQFRLAAAVLRPREITFLDDGANTIPFAASVLGERAYERPGVNEGRLTRSVAPFALEHVSRRAAHRAVTFATVFDLGTRTEQALADRGYRVGRHAFEWTRRTARPAPGIGRRVILGSALPVDGRMPLAEFVAWVGAVAQAAPTTYLPHRRETAAQLARIAAVPGVTVHDTGLPVELLLAGTPEPLEVFTLRSSTTTTLPLVLAGTGSQLRIGAPGSPAQAGAPS